MYLHSKTHFNSKQSGFRQYYVYIEVYGFLLLINISSDQNLQNGVVPGDTHRFGPLMGLQKLEVQNNGSLEGVGERFSIFVDHYTHYRCVNDGMSWKPGHM